MGFLSRIAQSADLVTGMADRLDIALDDRLLHHTEQESYRLRGMIMRCAGCTEKSACATLQNGTTHLDAAPAYCRNRDALAAMQVA